MQSLRQMIILYSPLVEQGQHDIKRDLSLSAIYLFPKQLSPHRSILLLGVRRAPRVLSSEDLRMGGGRRGGRGGYGDHSYGNHAPTSTNSPYHGPPPPTYSNGRGRIANDYSHGYASNSSRPPQQQYGGYGSGGPRTFPPSSNYGGNSNPNGRGAPLRPVSGPYSRGGYHSGPPGRGGYVGGGGGYGDGGSHGYGYGGGFNNTSSYSSGYGSGSYDGGYSSGRGGPPRGRSR